jgi:hypothetical protein
VICEFLAAFETVQGQREGWKQLLSKHKELLSKQEPHNRTRLLEVIPFACGLLPRVHRDQALSDVAAIGDFRLLARCFFETKLYEHSSWPAFVRKAQNEILASPAGSWDERWLGDLHLLTLVVRDAQQSSIHIAVAGATDISDLYKALIERQSDSLTRLLGAYAAQDAAGVFRVAELCKLDLPKSFPEVVIKNCDQPPFLALVIDQSNREPDRAALWLSLIAEAGLRSRVVARILDERAPDDALDSSINQLPNNTHWFLRSFLRKTYYTQIVTIAVQFFKNTPATDSVMPFAFLALISAVPPPSQRKFRIGIEKWAMPVAMLTIFGFMFLSLFQHISHSLALTHWPFVVTIFFVITHMYLTLFHRGYSYAYRELLNLLSSLRRIQPLPPVLKELGQEPHEDSAFVKTLFKLISRKEVYPRDLRMAIKTFAKVRKGGLAISDMQNEMSKASLRD